MTTEEKLKAYILTQYKSVREFVNNTDIPYSTFDTILKRGVANASIKNIFKVCAALNISADELAEGNIVPAGATEGASPADIVKAVDYARANITAQSYTLDGVPVSAGEMEKIIDSVEISLELIRRERKRNKRLRAYAEALEKRGNE